MFVVFFFYYYFVAADVQIVPGHCPVNLFVIESFPSFLVLIFSFFFDLVSVDGGGCAARHQGRWAQAVLCNENRGAAARRGREGSEPASSSGAEERAKCQGLVRDVSSFRFSV